MWSLPYLYGMAVTTKARPGPVDPLVLHDGALDATGAVVTRVRSDQLLLPTPCAEWDVGRLIEHLIEGNEMFTRAIDGETADVAADDPREAYARSAEAVRRAWRRPGVLAQEARLPFGAIPGVVAVRMHFVDHLVHGWDLATATGQDNIIDLALATAAFEEMTQALDDSARGPGMAFAPQVAWPAGAPLHERLVAFLGRHPRDGTGWGGHR